MASLPWVRKRTKPEEGIRSEETPVSPEYTAFNQREPRIYERSGKDRTRGLPDSTNARRAVSWDSSIDGSKSSIDETVLLMKQFY